MRINIRYIDKIIDKITSIAMIYCLSLMLIFVFSQVIARDLFHMSLYIIDELARYLMVAFCFLSGSLALRKKEFIGVSFAVDRLPAKLREYADLIAVLSTILFLSFGTIYGIRLIIGIFETNQLSPAMQMPIAYAYLPIPIGFLLMLITSLIHLYDLVINLTFGIKLTKQN